MHFYHRYTSSLQNLANTLAAETLLQTRIQTCQQQIQIIQQKIQETEIIRNQHINKYQKLMEKHGERLNYHFNLEEHIVVKTKRRQFTNHEKFLFNTFKMQAQTLFAAAKEIFDQITAIEIKIEQWQKELLQVQQSLTTIQAQLQSNLKNNTHSLYSPEEIVITEATTIAGNPPLKCRPYF